MLKTKNAFMKKFDKLEWFAINLDTNSGKPYYINIMKCIDSARLFSMLNYKGNKPNEYNCISEYKDLYDFIKRQIMSRYWSRVEYEMLISELFNRKEEYTKIDVFDQILPNLNKIVNYINVEMEIGFDHEDIKEKLMKF